jgi:hypothetical protein
MKGHDDKDKKDGGGDPAPSSVQEETALKRAVPKSRHVTQKHKNTKHTHMEGHSGSNGTHEETGKQNTKQNPAPPIALQVR